MKMKGGGATMAAKRVETTGAGTTITTRAATIEPTEIRTTAKTSRDVNQVRREWAAGVT